ncbi:hypothetical protein [Planococcus sp. ISL-109]|uniref:hypothetical protein n=1 Tax=Planococcus sp. ISL-109 TaxID=2819166 RepID=UPI001BE7B4EE|nr:hypothetical protein [Planococcus sp. ISL-109]MBT2583111.1 hypothetical protein [Planococcus sp. ISL-109]
MFEEYAEKKIVDMKLQEKTPKPWDRYASDWKGTKMIMKLEVTEMLAEEVNFKLLDFVQTANGKWLSIGFLDNVNKKTLSKKTAHFMYEKGQIIKRSEEIEGKTVVENLIH